MLSSFYKKAGIEAGIDEAGRGPLAGPVLAAAVVLDKTFTHPRLNDSKKIPKIAHRALSVEIKEKAIAWGVALASVEEIDKYNILNATLIAMHRAIEDMLNKTKLNLSRLLVDGNQFKPFHSIPHYCIIKGDSIFCSIAAASILAKVARDEIMLNWDEKYPMFGWRTNAGYPTKSHRLAIEKYGVTPLHRKTFKWSKK